MAEDDEDRDRDPLAPHPFGMPEERRVPVWVVPAAAAALGVLLLAVALGAFALQHNSSGGARPRPASGSPSGPTPSSEPKTPDVSTTSAVSGTATEGVTDASDTPSGTSGSPQPVAAGSKLPALQAPPQGSVGLVLVPRGFAGAEFAIVFTPYGVGASGSAGGTLFAKVVSSKPSGSKHAFAHDFTGEDLALYAPAGVLAAVTGGGRYKGMLQVRPQGDVGVLILTRAEPSH